MSTSVKLGNVDSAGRRYLNNLFLMLRSAKKKLEAGSNGRQRQGNKKRRQNKDEQQLVGLSVDRSQ